MEKNGIGMIIKDAALIYKNYIGGTVDYTYVVLVKRIVIKHLYKCSDFAPVSLHVDFIEIVCAFTKTKLHQCNSFEERCDGVPQKPLVPRSC